MQQEPLFSVVIPTRNRAHLLRNAIQSVLWQSFDDYELIISDNCSADNTADVVAEVGGNRTRLVRPERVLAMPDHWEFALDHACGQFVAYLCDDDAWAPDALARISQVLASSASKLAVLSSGLYYAPNWLDPKLRNAASFTASAGDVSEHRSDQTIQRLFHKCGIVNEAPRMLNSFCHRKTMLRVRAAAGKLFVLCPDYSFPVRVLTEIPAWLYVDELLHVQGVFPEGIGSTYVFNRGEPGQEYLREFEEERLLRHVPLKSSVVSNLITETLLMSKAGLPKLAGYDVSWVQYFIGCWNDLMVLKRNGVDISADQEEFWSVLAAQPAGVRERVTVVVTRPEGEDPSDEWTRRHPVRASVRRMINHSANLSSLESLLRGRRGNQARSGNRGENVVVTGEVAGFDNILECARKLPTFCGQAEAAGT